MELDVEELAWMRRWIVFSWVELLPTLYLRRKLATFDSVDCALKWYILWSLGGRSKGRN